ncbi:MAG: phosphotransferase [Desulfobulbales bacterium]|nr:phosphotransferase [Desulfobulbales bacterium]
MSADPAVKITAPERRVIAKLLKEAGFDPLKVDFALLAGDGSERRFCRARQGHHSLILILANPADERGLAEARSAWLIGNHLRRCGVVVPEIFGYDSATGVIACEDLGDILLHDEISAGEWPEERLIGVYEEAVGLLAHMQVVGGNGFKAEWCWQTGVYDRRLMLARESGYFLESFCRGFLGIGALPAGLAGEFIELAESAAAAPAGFFLHRDFQSRNLMLHNGCLRVIDFQGGRFGPLGYDLASLLIDPYAALPAYVQERLVQKYMETLSGYSGVGGAFSIENYYLLALQRNLQILGAFAFLSEVRRKVFFRGYLAPATLNLHRLLQEPGGRCFPVLRAFADELPGMVEQRLLRFRLS